MSKSSNTGASVFFTKMAQSLSEQSGLISLSNYSATADMVKDIFPLLQIVGHAAMINDHEFKIEDYIVEQLGAKPLKTKKVKVIFYDPITELALPPEDRNWDSKDEARLQEYDRSAQNLRDSYKSENSQLYVGYTQLLSDALKTSLKTKYTEEYPLNQMNGDGLKLYFMVKKEHEEHQGSHR